MNIIDMKNMKKVILIAIAIFIVSCACTDYLYAQSCNPPCSAEQTCVVDFGNGVKCIATTDVNSQMVIVSPDGTAAFAETAAAGSASGVALGNPLGESGGLPENIIATIIQYALGLSGVLALIAFIYGGIWWLVSLGDSNKVTKGKEIMKWAVIGLLVIFSSFAIVNMMFDLFGVK